MVNRFGGIVPLYYVFISALWEAIECAPAIFLLAIVPYWYAVFWEGKT